LSGSYWLILAIARAAIQVVEVRMGDEHKINGWEIVELDAGILDALDNF
jgi:hypothetical protein